MTKIEREALQPTYQEILGAVDGNEELLLKIFKQMSGQQINLPVHLYDANMVKKIIQEKAKKQPINVNEEAERFGYSRRWVRLAIKEMK